MTVRPVALSLFPEIQAEWAIGPVLPSVFVGSNADLMAAVAPLYLVGDVMDCTYGKGKWWTRHRPPSLVAHDLHTLDGVDFRSLPEPDETYDTVCFDPPYLPNGGYGSSSRQGFRDSYGLTDEVGGERRLWDLVAAGLSECARVTKVGGVVLVKCTDFVYANDLTLGHRRVLDIGDSIGLRCHDLIIHHTGSGPGGHNIFTVLRARRHHSYLLALRKTPRIPAPPVVA
jgi:hypothetical protein